MPSQRENPRPILPKTSTLFACAALLLAASAHAQQTTPAEPEKDPIAILELGAATSWDTHGGAAQFAPDIAIEATPIEGWLELEAGTNPYITRTSTEWDTDLLFKKPWTLSHSAEFMAGIGPEWTHRSQNGHASNGAALELIGDFMFWPARRHRFGWYLEPAFDRTFGSAPASSLGISAGLLIAIP